MLYIREATSKALKHVLIDDKKVSSRPYPFQDVQSILKVPNQLKSPFPIPPN